ncbi:MAG: hypothetical protein FIB07_12355 [Candidatus Methanoperedens sp.]|nr:hypothetical protein [Candidatus Methanoperedens sp.]
MKKQNRKFVAAIIILVLASFVLTNKLLGNSPGLNLVMNGSTVVIERPEKLFTYPDLLLSTFSSFVLGTTIMYLLAGRWRGYSESISSESKEVEEKKSEKWRVVLDALKEDEYKVYKEILDAGGEMLQKDLVALSCFNGPKVTRILDNLEKRNCIERKSYGMTNLVRLK